MLVAFSVSPMDTGDSVSHAVAEAVRVVRESGLPNRTDSMFTTIEGEWDEVFAAVRRCHEVLHAMGAPRISSTLRFGTRVDRAQTMDDKIESVTRKLDPTDAGAT